MATAKAFQAERMNKAADRLDWLMANARVLRSRASGLHGDPDRRQA